ncbi:hypothetical protein DFH06DRAFT_1137096 [Mycena polygramma]|nr:hypothetical protein DFH06DRAFT_1137096 [Mycena polygramma]
MSDFGRGPPLGVYNTVAVSMMRGTPYNCEWARVFSSLDIATLFLLSLRSREMFRLVLEYVKEQSLASSHVDELTVRKGGPLDRLSKIPVNLILDIFEHLRTSDKVNLARVSLKYRALCSRDSQQTVSRMLQGFDLRHVEIRFMQAATLTIIAGDGITDFMTHASRPTSLHFYVPALAYSSVVRFFELATRYESWPEDVVHDHAGVRRRTGFHRPYVGPSISVNQSLTDSAMDCVPYFPFSHLMVSITHLGSWFAYPNLMHARVTYPNRESLNLRNPRTRDQLYMLIREVVGTHRIRFDRGPPHECGVSLDCPATARHTGDEGCFKLFFPGPFMGSSLSTAPSIYPSTRQMSWFLGGRRCILRTENSTLLRVRSDDSVVESISYSRRYTSASHFLLCYPTCRDIASRWHVIVSEMLSIDTSYFTLLDPLPPIGLDLPTCLSGFLSRSKRTRNSASLSVRGHVKSSARSRRSTARPWTQGELHYINVASTTASVSPHLSCASHHRARGTATYMATATKIKICVDGIFTPLDQTYDTTEPHLGLYDQMAVEMMNAHFYGEHWAFVFRRLDVVSLFKLGMRTAQLFRLVMEYVSRHMPDSGHIDERGPRDMLSKLPVELFPQIFAAMKFADRLGLGGTSRKFHALRAREFQAAVRRLCARFGLSYVHIRFMQSATSAVIAGTALQSVLDYDHAGDHLDFYAPNLTYPWVLRFFELAIGYTPFPDHAFHRRDGVQDRKMFYQAAFNAFIHVMRSRTDSGLDCVPYSLFSHLFWAATHYGIWMGYPRSTAAGVSFPNRDCTDVASGKAYHHVCAVVREYSSRYRFRFALREPHVCGRSFECPMTPRHAGDGGCLNVFFPSAPMGLRVEKVSVYPGGSAMSWSLDGRGCGRNDSAPASRTAPRCRVDGYATWKAQLQDVIRKISCLSRTVMAFPIVRRIELDESQGSKNFLVNAVYGLDFAATRDRSTASGGLWTFKRCEPDEPDDETRGRLCVFFTHVFGRVDLVVKSRNGYIVRIGCPLELLHAAITGEACNSVQLKLKHSEPMFTTGNNVEMVVGLTRTQTECDVHPSHSYAIRSTEFWTLSSRDMPRKNDGDVCDTGLKGCPTSGRTRSLCSAQYGIDFLPTRDGSMEDGKTSKFTFKDLSPITGEVPATDETQAYLREFTCLAFGEVVSVEILGKDHGVAFELACPEDASCSAVELYLRQLAALRSFLHSDVIEAEGTCAGSWFTSPTSRAVGDEADKGFWILVKPLYAGYPQVVAQQCTVGNTIDVIVSFQRNDRKNDTTGANELTYSLVAQRPIVLDREEVPRKGNAAVPYSAITPFGRIHLNLLRVLNLCQSVMSASLRHTPMRTRLTNIRFAGRSKGLGLYEVDFQANRVRSVMGGKGSQFVYRHVAPPPWFVYGDFETRTAHVNRIFTLVGSVVGIHGSMVSLLPALQTRTEPRKLAVAYLTLGLPDNATDEAAQWFAQQEDDLAHIARVDQANADGLQKVIWGPQHSYVETSTPTVIISVYKEEWRNLKLKKGDDVARYMLVAEFVGKLEKDQLRRKCPRISSVVRIVTVREESFELSSGTMMSRMQNLGVLSVARAKYGRDFAPVRKCSLDGGGSLYLMKNIPEIMLHGTHDHRGILANYTGHVFGEIDEVFTLPDDTEAVMRLRLPPDASCALTRLFLDQEDVMRSIMDTDDHELGGYVKDSFFDLTASHPTIHAAPHSFYVSLEPSAQLIAMLRTPRKAVAKMSFSRYDEVDEQTGEIARSYRIDMWSLDIRATDYFPTRNQDGYVCDVNGPAGCSETSYRIDPYSEKRQTLQRYMPLVFGAIRQTYICDDGLRFCVLLQCPRGVSCEARLMYYKQCRTLRNIIREELSDSGKTDSVQPGSVRISWFDQDTEGFCVPAKQSGFYVMVQADSPTIAAQFEEDFCTKEALGQIVQFVVTLERRDQQLPAGLEKVYTIYAAEYQFQEDGCLPTVSDGRKVPLNRSCRSTTRRRYYYMNLACHNLLIRPSFDHLQCAAVHGCFETRAISSTTMAIITVPLTTLQTISEIQDGFATGGDCVTAFLFPTGAAQPMTVKVPIVDAAAPKTVDNVRYMAWMATDPAHPLTNLESLDMEVTAPNGEELSFTIFCPDQERPMGRLDLLHPINQ